MKLITEPDDGISPVLEAIEKAKESIEITIFRFDRKDIENALAAAVKRGVKVTALVAYANRGGEKQLRKLEMRFLQAGMIVARTAGDLTRYHYKLMIVDRRKLFVLSFNFTHLDIVHSRSFGIVTSNAATIAEALKLFEADSTRTEYGAGVSTFLVSPVNARAELERFIRKAKQQLCIYDPEVSDSEITRILKERAKAGVEIRIIGRLKGVNLSYAKLKNMRLHTRTIIRDGQQAFVGSQSLRSMELDQRREVGIIVREPGIVKSLLAVFQSDWKEAEPVPSTISARKKTEGMPAGEMQKKLIRQLEPIAADVKRSVKKVAASAGPHILQNDKIKSTVKKVIKKAVKEAVEQATRKAINEKSLAS